MAVASTFCRDGVAGGVCELLGKWGHVGNVVRGGMLGTDGGHAGVGSFAGFREGIVAGVKVFAFLLQLDEVSYCNEKSCEGKEQR